MKRLLVGLVLLVVVVWGMPARGEERGDGVGALLPSNSITIVHEAVPADGTDFGFGLPSISSSFMLDDAMPDDGDGITNSVTFTGIVTGSYELDVMVPDGWVLESVVCTTNGVNGPVGREEGVTIQMGDSENVVCTLRSVQPGRITIAIEALPADGTDFVFNGVSTASTYRFLGQWGSRGSGSGQFEYPTNVAVDSAGNVYVTEMGNYRIQKFDGGGYYLTEWGTHGASSVGELYRPWDIEVDEAGHVFVSVALYESFEPHIQKFDSDGLYLAQWGSQGSEEGQFQAPYGIGIDGVGNVYVADVGNNRIQKFDNDGVYLTQWGMEGSSDGVFLYPHDVGIDHAGNIFVLDTGNYRVQKFDYTGAYLTQWGYEGGQIGQFQWALGLALDRMGNVYVADARNYRIQKFDNNGNYLTQWGNHEGQFYPTGTAIDSMDHVYVVDSPFDRVIKFGVSEFESILPHFLLDDAIIDDGDDVTEHVTFDGLPLGTYTITEMVPSSWTLHRVVCVTNDKNDTPLVSGASVSIDLDAGEDVVCTFVNTQGESIFIPTIIR